MLSSSSIKTSLLKMCKGTNKNGTQCKRPVKDTNFCHWHINQDILDNAPSDNAPSDNAPSDNAPSDNPPSECIVCCENIVKPLECGHLIHVKCVKKSLHPKCPVCCKDLSHLFTKKEISRMQKREKAVVNKWTEDMISEYSNFSIMITDLAMGDCVCDDCFLVLRPLTFVRFMVDIE